MLARRYRPYRVGVVLPPAPQRLTLDGGAFVANWRALTRVADPAACGAAVKADGYGIGAVEAARRLAGAGCRDFFVATWAEAAEVAPVIGDAGLSVLHGIGPRQIEAALASPARPVLNSAEQVARWRAHGGGRPCDVMVDTGMNRLGLTTEQACSGLLDGLAIDILMSHLACADEPGHPLNAAQLARFVAVRQSVPARRYSLANSAGSFLGRDYAFDLVRPGLALYGGVPVPEDMQQRRLIAPVARIEADVVQLRDVPAGASIGYGASFVAPAPLRAAIVNLGYGDGYLRQLASGGAGTIDGTRLPILGRISMDLIALEATAAPGLAEGDAVAMEFDLPALASASNLTQYELLTMLGRRYERVWR